MSPSRRVVLIVDCDPAITRLVVESMSRFDVDCRVSADSRSAERELERGDVALAFVDANMPELDGIQLMRNSHERGEKTSFVLMSDTLTEAQKNDAILEGAKTILRKPLKQHELAYAFELIVAEME